MIDLGAFLVASGVALVVGQHTGRRWLVYTGLGAVTVLIVFALWVIFVLIPAM